SRERRGWRVFVAEENGRHFEDSADHRRRRGRLRTARLAQPRDSRAGRGRRVQLSESSGRAETGAVGADRAGTNPPDTVFTKIESGNLPARVAPILRGGNGW